MENTVDRNKPGNMQGEKMATRKFATDISNNITLQKIQPHVVKKIALSQTNDNKEKSIVNQVHRPITRSLSAQIANKKKFSPKDVLKPKKSTENVEIFEDEEDRDMPMPLETTEPEKDLMEVEMEDVLEEPVVDIDIVNTNNPLAVVEYVEDLYDNYRKIESYGMVSRNYMLTQQSDINEKMRAILIDWLIEVHHQCHYRHETLFLTVNIIDRYLAKRSVSKKKLQLVGLVAMLLACKYERVSVSVGVADLISLSDNCYSRSEILEMEILMLNTLEYKLSVPTAYMFLKRFLKAAQSNSRLNHTSFFLMELCLVEYEALKFTPSLLAAASVYTAQCSIYRIKQWSKTCEWHTKYSEEQLLECSRMIVGYHQQAATGRLTTV